MWQGSKVTIRQWWHEWYTSLPRDNNGQDAILLQSVPILLVPLLPPLLALLAFTLLRTFSSEPSPPALLIPPFSPILKPLFQWETTLGFIVMLVLLLLRRQILLAILLLIGIWLLIAVVSVVNTGVRGHSPALLLIPICAASFLAQGWITLGLASSATILLVGVFQRDGGRVQPPIGIAGMAGPRPLSGFDDLVFWVMTIWTIALLAWLLARLWRTSLQNSLRHAQELEKMRAQLAMRVDQQTNQLLEQERTAAIIGERTRLAREIHDTIAQGLTSVVMQLSIAQKLLHQVTDVANQQIELALRMSRESLAEARRSVWNLRSPSLEGSDLIEALQNLLSRPLSGGAKTHFALSGEPWPLAPDVESAMLRVTQEALSNVNRHAHASDVWVDMIFAPESVQLHICDNGHGFDPQILDTSPLTAQQPWGGFGLIGMRERIEALGGMLTIASASQQGVQIHIVIPHQHAAFDLMRVAYESTR